jgi:hypothetical protein
MPHDDTEYGSIIIENVSLVEECTYLFYFFFEKKKYCMGWKI